MTRDFTNIAKKILFLFQFTPIEYEKQIFNNFLEKISHYENENIYNIFSYVYEMFQWRYNIDDVDSENELLVDDLLFILSVKEKQFKLSLSDMIYFEKILDEIIIKVKKLYIKCIISSISKYFLYLGKINVFGELKNKIISFGTKYRNVILSIIDKIENNKNMTFENMELFIYNNINENRYTMNDVDILYNQIIIHLSYKK
jgi:hypothetical protein